ncbi:uncharacterized protein LOC105643613 isoform X2 [Jatropha curcas]|uniref:uncharacterized protein LOC105643613 isoform X2 n=1 Tax=Jatropha curcas TaxID=180498 RepID=UPI0009D6DD78|nr:uncharacterized protein LOC105643613 isoform X2 [Jatropha curcas]
MTMQISEKIPPYYAVEIQKFSAPKDYQVTKYESEVFEAQEYKWKLVVHLKGSKSKDHISLYLALADTLEPHILVYAVFRLYLLDRKNHNHLIRQLPGKKICFHKRKLEWGFDKFINVAAFRDPSNGYLVGDACVVGVEVISADKATITGKEESLSINKQGHVAKHLWKIEKFSKLSETRTSEIFTDGIQEWKIELHPEGTDLGKMEYLSLYVCLGDDNAIDPSSKIYTHVTLRVLDQLKDKHIIAEENFWFDSTRSRHGWSRFLPLDYLHRFKKSLQFEDVLFVDAEVKVLAVTNVH